MANEKTINTRIQLKYDSYSNWTTHNPTLRPGEVAIAYLTTAEAVKPGEGDTQHPVLFKVGPGAFNSLPWASALAADVHGWAKKTEAEFTTWVKGLISVDDIDAYSKGEVDGLLSANSTADQKYAKEYADGLAKNYDAAGTAQGLINGLNVTDTAVTGKYVSAVSETNGKIEVTREDLPTYTLASGTANGTVAFNGADVAVTGLGSAAYTDAKNYATAAQGVKADSALQAADVVTGSANGTVSVKGTDVAVKGLGSAAYTDAGAYEVAGAAATAKSEAITAAKSETESQVNALRDGAVKGNTDAISAIKDHASVDSFGDVMTEMAKYQLAGDYATKTEAQGYADAKDAAIKAAKDAADAAQADIDAFMAAADTGDAALDTLKEIQDFLNSDDGTVQTLIDKVAANVEAIADFVDGTTPVAKATLAETATKASGLNDAGVAAVKAVKVDAAGHADTASGLDAAGLAQVKGVKVDSAASADDAAKLGGVVAVDYLKKTDAPGYDDILTATNAAAAYQPKGEYATAAQGAKADTALQPAALDNYYTKSAADAEFMNATETGSAIDAKITALNLASTYEPIGAETRAKAYADGLAGNYATAAQGAKADTALQEITTTANGGLKVTNKNQIDFDPNVVFVFNCGSSTELVD